MTSIAPPKRRTVRPPSTPTVTPLRVAHLAFRANPYGPNRLELGLPDVTGKLPLAEAQLGIQSTLLLPLSDQTRATLDQAQLGRLREVDSFHLGQLSQSLDDKAVVLALEPAPGFPVYFIGSQKAGVFTPPPDASPALGTLAFFNRAALKFLMRAGLPHIINCHDWETAPALIYAHYLKAFGLEPGWPEVRTVYSVHDLQTQGRFPVDDSAQLGLGLEQFIPIWATAQGELNLLKSGLSLADISCSRSLAYAQEAAAGLHGEQLGETAKQMLDGKRLVGICQDDSCWTPARELGPENMVELALRMLGVYRSQVPFRLPEMARAMTTFPPLTLRHLTPEDQLEVALPRLHRALTAPDRELLCQLIKHGQGERLQGIREEAELTRLLAFLRIKPTCDLESKLAAAEITDFVRACGLYPGDIDRLFSLELDLKISQNRELLAQCPGQERITLYEAMTKTEVIGHLVRILKMLQMIWVARDFDTDTVAEIMRPFGLGLKPADVRSLSLRLRDVVKEAGRPFLIFVLLHDIGKFIDRATHSAVGFMLLNKRELVEPLLALVGMEELKRVRQLVLFHLTFGLYTEQALGGNTQLAEFWRIACSQLRGRGAVQRQVDSLLLLSLPDAQSHIDGYDRTEYLRLCELTEILTEARDEADLQLRFNAKGFTAKHQGLARWNDLVLASPEKNLTGRQKKRIEKANASAAKVALASFRFGAKPDRISEESFFTELGSFDIFAPKRTFGRLPDLNHRLRLAFWLFQLRREHPFAEVKFGLSRDLDQRQTELARLSDLLTRDDLAGFRALAKPQKNNKLLIDLVSNPAAGKEG